MLAYADTTPNVGIAVPGILAPGKVDGVDVNLLPYFDGSLASSNRGGSSGVAVNNLDGGGAEPLKKNMPANSNTSNQYFLLTHLYAFFGSLLGCTTYGMPGFPAYDGFPSQYQVHKFMDLDHHEVSYFIQQVGLAASSFGVSKDDVTAVGGALDKLFNYKCLPPATAIKAQGPQLQSICAEETVSGFPALMSSPSSRFVISIVHVFRAKEAISSINISRSRDGALLILFKSWDSRTT